MNTDNFERIIQQYDMLPAGVRVLCAVSGGADSVCLLQLLRERGENEIVCAHFNHRLRGAESDRDERFVRELCRLMGIQCVVGSGDVGAYAGKNGMGAEEAAREMRYAFLHRAARENGCGRIATAHNADDNAETVLLNLARGAGLKGLCGIPPVRGDIIRPLLLTTRDEIVRFLEQKGLPHVEDSTNLSDDYSRNRLRHSALPVLKSVNSGAVMNIARASESLRRDEDYLSGEARRFIEANLMEKSLSVLKLSELPACIQLRVFRQMCGSALAENHAMAIMKMCQSGQKHMCADIPGMRVTKDFDRLSFGAEAAGPLPDMELPVGGTLEISELKMRINCKQVIAGDEIHKTFNTFRFKSESICGTISVTSRKPGDRIALSGRGCTKTLKKLFSESALPLAERERVPVFRDGAGVIAVYGFGTDARCKYRPGDDIIEIEVLKEDKRGTYEE